MKNKLRGLWKAFLTEVKESGYAAITIILVLVSLLVIVIAGAYMYGSLGVRTMCRTISTIL
jgi:hypothetical protein